MRRIERQEILDRLDIRALYESELPSIKVMSSGQGQALCPFHNDTKPSLSVNLNTGYFYCHGNGCRRQGSIFDFYMARHGVDFTTAKIALAREAGLTTEPPKKIIKRYNYTDETRNLLFQVERYEPKDFRQRRPDGNGGWVYNLSEVRLVPYNLPGVIKTQTIVIAEGEKDADILNRMGITATCNPMGAGKWKPEYNRFFEDTRVAILPDNDEAGREHAQSIAKNLQGIAESVKVVELTGLTEKGDISDWIAQGGTKEQLDKLIREAPEWTPDRSYLIRVADILHGDNEPIKWDVEDILPEGGVTLLSAPPSHYKTWLALDIARSVSTGGNFLGRPTRPKQVYYIDRENPRTVLRNYLRKLGVTGYEPLKVWPLWSDREAPLFPSDDYLELARERPLIIFDSLIRFYSKGVDENKSTDISQIMSFLRSLIKEGATVLVLHHTGKADKSEYRGSSDILGGVDMAYTIKKSEGLYVLNLKCIKSRFQMEKDIPVEIVSDDVSLRFEDATLRIVQAKEKEELETMEAIRGVIQEFQDQHDKPPNQSELIALVNEKLGISKHDTRPLLIKGKDTFWKSEGGGIGKPIFYKTFETTFPPFQDIYSSGKLERLENHLPDSTSEVIEVLEVCE
jgi:5S rRNA maturation endonuclease (ribonuclease M5)